LKVMEEFNIQGKQTSFYKYCPGTFGYILVPEVITEKKIVSFSLIFWAAKFPGEWLLHVPPALLLPNSIVS